MQRQIIKKQSEKAPLRPLIITLLAAGAAVVASVGVSIVLARIIHNPGTRDKARHFAKQRYNPIAKRFAGGRFRIYSLLRHTGRHSGREYVTPLEAFPLGDGFIIPLPYGRNTDWCRNVLAAGTCTLRYNNHEYSLERPEIQPREELEYAFPWLIRFIFVRGHIEEVLWLHRQKVPLTPGGNGDKVATV